MAGKSYWTEIHWCFRDPESISDNALYPVLPRF